MRVTTAISVTKWEDDCPGVWYRESVATPPERKRPKDGVKGERTTNEELPNGGRDHTITSRVARWEVKQEAEAVENASRLRVPGQPSPGPAFINLEGY